MYKQEGSIYLTIFLIILSGLINSYFGVRLSEST